MVNAARRIERMPRTVGECLIDSKTYRPEVIAAVKALRRAKAWRGTVEERVEKFRTLHRALCKVYRISPGLVFQNVHLESDSGASQYRPDLDTIYLRGRLSVVTYLLMFAYARGGGHRSVRVWSFNLFRRMFPLSYSRCRHVGSMLIKR